MTTPIALALIVRNEAPTIAQTLESARAALGPGPTIVHDTGSTDGTEDAIRDWAANRPCRVGPGEGVTLHHRPFDDFSQARNAVLAHAFDYGGGTRLVCMVDAGVVVSGAFEPVNLYGVGAYTATIRLGNLEFARPQIFTRGWSYTGRVHECAIAGRGAKANEAPSGLVFDYCLKDTARAKRWVRDLALLEGDRTPRGMFYYAQTLDLLGRRKQAIAAYLERAELAQGFYQERVIAYMRCIPLAHTVAEAEGYLHRVLELDPSRGDAWLDMCAAYESAQDWAGLALAATRAVMLQPRDGAMFVNTDREWRALVYLGDAESSRGRYALARDYWRSALERGGERIPADERACLALAIAEGERVQS